MFQIEHFFSNLKKYFFQFFPSATRQGTMKFQIEAIYWGCEKIGNKYFFKK